MTPKQAIYSNSFYIHNHSGWNSTPAKPEPLVFWSLPARHVVALLEVLPANRPWVFRLRSTVTEAMRRDVHPWTTRSSTTRGWMGRGGAGVSGSHIGHPGWHLQAHCPRQRGAGKVVAVRRIPNPRISCLDRRPNAGA